MVCNFRHIKQQGKLQDQTLQTKAIQIIQSTSSRNFQKLYPCFDGHHRKDCSCIIITVVSVRALTQIAQGKNKS